MKHYANKVDGGFGAILLVSGVVSALIIVATLAYQIALLGMLPPGDPQPRLWPMCVPYSALLAGVLLARHQFLGRGVQLWVYVLLTCLALLALRFSFIWFCDPMHDIALFFGSHGRWGCALMKDHFTRVHFIRDDTVPWILFVPLTVAPAAHWVWQTCTKKG